MDGDTLTEQPLVAILLCTYRGQQYLVDQLESFASQTMTNWHVFASDDGSQDDTLQILARYQKQWGVSKLSLLSGPAKGFSANFLSLVCCTDIHADLYAYSDQDDIWEPHKLQTAVNWLQSVPADVPALYCSRTQLVDADNNHIGLSPLFSRPPCFANALMQNIGGGNTMVFNHAARLLLQMAGNNFDVVTHDWWTYLVVTACGGQVRYDPCTTVRYRQHGANMVGMNSSWIARLARARLMARGRFIHWSNQNIDALTRLENRITPENSEILELFTQSRQHRLLPRLRGLKRTGIYRQSWLSNLGLIVAVIFRKI